MISDTGLQDRIRKAFPFLRRASRDFERDLFRSAGYVRLDSGQFICREGSRCAHLALLLTGSVRVYNLGETGREITLYRLEAGQSCILTVSCILSQLPFPAFAVTETAVEGVVIRPADVIRWVAESEEWRAYVFGLIAARLSDVITLVQEVTFQRMDRRIAAHLLHLAAQQTGDELRVTHQDIASDLGTSREVVSRILKDLEGEDLLATSRGSIRLLDRSALESKARE